MKRSPAQRAATKRAWLIVRLRGAYHLFGEIKSSEGMNVCDSELLKLGAKPEGLQSIKNTFAFQRR